ncbi:MAG: hypothetical protein E7185_09835 [Erysipelotrichaceae bacterium]|nr:hypothetical protein [Erysipelotrichaceae bacterium]
MFIDDEQTEAIAERIVQVLRALELEVMLDICRRLRLAGEITRTADYQLWRLSQISAFKGNYEKMIKKVLNLTDKELQKLYDDVIAKGYTRDQAIYDAANIPFTPFEDNLPLQQLITAVQAQTHDAIENITQTTGFIDLQRNTEVSLTQYFQNVLDKTHLEISTGTMSYDQAISKAVNDMVMSGMRSDHNGDLWIKYDNPGKKPWRNRVDVATRRAVMTGITQVTGKISDQNAEKLHTEWFEVSAHSTARPTHMIWQGKVYTKEQLYTVCGLGTGPGLLGWNCYHHYDAFLPGVSVRKWTDKQLADMRKEASVKKEYGGKKYTLYEATQRQRQLETRMRAVRQKVELLKEAGASKQMISAAKAQQTALYKEYKAFSQHFGLPEQINRVYYRNYKTAPVTVQRVENAPGIGYKEPFTDIRDEYVSINPVPPGRVTKDEGYLNDETHQRDEATAEWFARTTGRDIHLLKEQGGEGVHTPDAEVNGKYWEFKDISSKSSINHQIEKGMTKQIVTNPGGMILNIVPNKETGEVMTDIEAINNAKNKLKFYQKYCTVDILIRNGNRVVAAFRMNKK